ncbi:trpp-1 [Pristionchus pacificus]|uniref:Trafficking protein particle complex subunit n=1 Tax=Pristionchus pacificus TaxID=54126 RepID=A0A2A6BGI1_PRIPA|nr:trpp-1 [Pristionchus pacificus]|eukprot:PDM64956.1 hypothetical protein PRIPAC_53212 [Pristionchus pacificus]
MAIYNLYIFNKDGTCIFYREWKREKQSGLPRSEEYKLMFGMLISLRSFAERLSTKDGEIPDGSLCYATTYSEQDIVPRSPTGLKMVLNTDPNANGVPDLVRGIYQAYVECITKNCLIDVSKEIQSDLFSSRVDQVVSAHSSYVH